jgi:hypothetical protein
MTDTPAPLNAFINRQSELAQLDAARRRSGTRRLPVSIAQLGRWWDNETEIDLVGLWHEQVVLVGECNWTNAPVGEHELTELRRKAARLPLADRPLWLLASRSGFTQPLRAQAAASDLLLPNRPLSSPAPISHAQRPAPP